MSSTPPIVCPKCAAAMEPGFLLDKSNSSSYASPPEWADGTVETSIWTGVKLKGHVRRPVVTYRCTRCGYLESYAREAE